MPDSYANLDPSFASSLQAMIEASGGRVQPGSGYRDIAEQTQLWNDAVAKYGSADAARQWVAPPGKSDHNKGLAMDLQFADDDAMQWAHDHAAEYGIEFPMAWENWHASPIGLRDGTHASSPYTAPPPAAPRTIADGLKKISSLLGMQSGGVLGNVDRGVLGSTQTAVLGTPSGQHSVTNSSSDTGVSSSSSVSTSGTPDVTNTTSVGNSSADPGTYDDWVNQVADMKGLTPEEKQNFYNLGMGESGGQNIPQELNDINMQNGTPAFGPWQMIESTFNQYAEPGHTDWHNPIDQGLASINYQRAEYGHIVSHPGY